MLSVFRIYTPSRPPPPKPKQQQQNKHTDKNVNNFSYLKTTTNKPKKSIEEEKNERKKKRKKKQATLIPSNLSCSVCIHVALLFTREDRKRLGRDANDAFATHLRLVHDATDCLLDGSVFATFKPPSIFQQTGPEIEWKNFGVPPPPPLFKKIKIPFLSVVVRPMKVMPESNRIVE